MPGDAVLRGTEISIHAPVKGATRRKTPNRPKKKHFNPRTREGCDHKPSPVNSRCLYFNPRTREGCDQVMDLAKLFVSEFQSTHP